MATFISSRKTEVSEKNGNRLQLETSLESAPFVYMTILEHIVKYTKLDICLQGR